jgi:septum formation protein
MLSLLSGKDHQVITGFCVLNPAGEIAHSESVTTAVRFKPISEEEIAGYIRTREPFGKAGAYAIQGVGAFMVESISGSYTNVVGLPMCALIKALIQCGALKSFP